MDRYYNGAHYHRAKDIDSYDVERLIRDCEESLIRSSQEFYVSDAGRVRKLIWTNLLFERKDGVFWQVTLKSATYNTGYAVESTYAVVVTAPSPTVAAAEIGALKGKYGVQPIEEGPAFYILRNDYNWQPARVPIDEKHAVSGVELELHYGRDVRRWSSRFTEGLASRGCRFSAASPGPARRVSCATRWRRCGRLTAFTTCRRSRLACSGRRS